MSSCLSSIQLSIADDLKKLNDLIAARLSTTNPLMDAVITNYLRSKGKQIRPLVVMLCAKMYGEVNDRVISAAAAVELLHNASLIHDDVVDNASTRRSMPTINSVWDNHIAVLMGDFFVSTSMQEAISTSDVRIISALCHLGRLLSIGELDQIYNARFHKLTEDAYFRIISYKTASLFVACARMGCYAVGASDEETERMARFAELMGQAFQIRDDIFDYFDGDVGKPTANDLREGKITLPLLHVLLDKNLEHHDEMLELSRREQLTEAEIEMLIAYARRHGGIEYAYETMERLRRRGAEILSECDPCPAAQSLMEIFDYIIERKK